MAVSSTSTALSVSSDSNGIDGGSPSISRPADLNQSIDGGTSRLFVTATRGGVHRSTSAFCHPFVRLPVPDHETSRRGFDDLRQTELRDRLRSTRSELLPDHDRAGEFVVVAVTTKTGSRNDSAAFEPLIEEFSERNDTDSCCKPGRSPITRRSGTTRPLLAANETRGSPRRPTEKKIDLAPDRHSVVDPQQQAEYRQPQNEPGVR